jgi:alpha-L-fucosidase
MFKKTLLFTTAMCFICGSLAAQIPYEPKWESLDARPCPSWYTDAKFGIFIHWGVYSVPAWGPKGEYAEWYWSSMQNKSGETWAFHKEMYGEDFPYPNFAADFKAELFEPQEWAELFKRSGAKYVVLTSKHHEGYCLWPSTHSFGWNSVDLGSGRDLLGELTEAVRNRGIKMGYYYSLYEWFNPLYKNDLNKYVENHMLPQMTELVEKYEPALIFADGEWNHHSSDWKSENFLAWLFNESSVKDEVVVNDRWGKDCRSRHGGYYTTEYGKVDVHGTKLTEEKPWEECRGIGSSFGYNRNESLDDYQSSKELIHMLIKLVSNGGNLLLNIGPTADGRIPVIMQQRLIDIGNWLEVNGEAIYSSAPAKGLKSDKPIRFTQKENYLYAICLEWPGKQLKLDNITCAKDSEIKLLGKNTALPWQEAGNGIVVDLSSLGPNDLPCEHAYTFKIKL